MSPRRTPTPAQNRLSNTLAHAALEAAGNVVFVTDRSGTIIWVNSAFTRVTGWTPEEAIGQNPRILQSGLHDRHYYARLWSEITTGRCFTSRVVNRSRDGRLYTVAQTVTPLPRGSADPTHFVAFQEDVSAEVEYARELEYLAYTDPLTGLENRRALLARLDEAWRRREPLAVMLMDMDDFKGINDRFGHEEGDNSLRRVATVLRRHDCGVAAFRLGGDEFVVLATGSTALDRPAMEDCAREIRARIAACDAGAGFTPLSVSIGVAFAPADGRDSSAILRSADLALARAKHDKTGVEIYTPDLGRVASREMAIRQDIAHALGSGQLTLAYQPIRSLASGATVAVEALLSWRHPRYGEIPRSEFAPIAERSGYMAPIGEWALREAVRRHVRRYRATGVRLHVDVSPVQLLDPLFAPRLSRVLAQEGLPGKLLDIEVTESMEFAASGVNEMLEAIDRLGIGIVIDGFGSGATPLGHLANLPVSGLKFAGSAVVEITRSRRHRDFIAGIIRLVHQAGLRVIAEGVESMEQAEVLLGIHCDEGQGVYLGYPMADTSLHAAQLAEVNLPPGAAAAAG